MEPRPQSSRSAPEQSPSGRPPSGSGRAPEETGGHHQQPDPTTVVAPPRADYDYSPLDLAPPGQRRRRQMVAAGLGGLVMLLLIAAVVFAYLVLREDDPDDNETDEIAVAQTEVAVSEATLAAQQTLVAGAVDDDPNATENDPEGAAGNDNEGGAPATSPAGENAETDNANDGDPTTADNEGENQAATESTAPAEGDTAGGPSEQELQALLPSQDVVPQGLDAVANSTRTQEEVVGALGGSREAETNLQEWGWSANVERSFTASNPDTLSVDATTDLTVSLHGFSTEANAADALTFYSDILLGIGYEEVEVGDIGATNRLMVQPQEDGGTTVALYVQSGEVLYRIGGYSPAGDPSQSVIDVAQAMLGQ